MTLAPHPLLSRPQEAVAAREAAAAGGEAPPGPPPPKDLRPMTELERRVLDWCEAHPCGAKHCTSRPLTAQGGIGAERHVFSSATL